jgi:hypothetical protein
LTVFDDDHFPVETVRVLKDPEDQSSEYVRVGRASAFPLAIHLDEDHVVRIDDPIGTSPWMSSGCPVELHTAVRKEAQHGIKTHVTKLAIMLRAVLHLEDLRCARW